MLLGSSFIQSSMANCHEINNDNLVQRLQSILDKFDQRISEIHGNKDNHQTQFQQQRKEQPLLTMREPIKGLSNSINRQEFRSDLLKPTSLQQSCSLGNGRGEMEIGCSSRFIRTESAQQVFDEMHEPTKSERKHKEISNGIRDGSKKEEKEIEKDDKGFKENGKNKEHQFVYDDVGIVEMVFDIGNIMCVNDDLKNEEKEVEKAVGANENEGNQEFQRQMKETLEQSIDEIKKEHALSMNAMRKAIKELSNSVNEQALRNKTTTRTTTFDEATSSYGYSSRLTKIEFPRFNGDGLSTWLYRTEQFFLLDKVNNETKVRLASIHFEERALQWFQNMFKQNGEMLRWDELKEALEIRFGNMFDDPATELKNLKQTGDAQEYHDAFDAIISRLNLPPDYALSCFLAGLNDEIELQVRMHQPRNIQEAFGLVKLQEPTQRAKKTKSISVGQDCGVGEEARMGRDQGLMTTNISEVISEEMEVMMKAHTKSDVGTIIAARLAYGAKKNDFVAADGIGYNPCLVIKQQVGHVNFGVMTVDFFISQNKLELGSIQVAGFFTNCLQSNEVKYRKKGVKKWLIKWKWKEELHYWDDNSELHKDVIILQGCFTKESVIFCSHLS